ncbi:copper homeostasis protein CutC [Exiguobacterium aestuarii]|uniref:PF03932 family protein CutC n=1 Tax=Exiguobacterium aestuarii TaxID=273527 RepID=A0ABW2PJM3_9BACL|nr:MULTISPECIES: copper homeostasis protein CutC [Exiguobacterium]MCT4785411.1 copper homeostasis protein CutC [Exiguobacterium aestuarii]
MKIEVIVTTLSEAIQAEQLGADRLELIADMEKGGITPSFGTIRNVVEHVSVPVHVMIRPHTRSFHFNEDDVETMLADIGLCRELGVDGIVFGALTQDGAIDERILGEVIKHKGEMTLTFHRAFDASRDVFESIDVLNDFPEVDLLLTSGGANTALEGIETLERLKEQAEMTILPGAGITTETLPTLKARLGVDMVHVGNGVRTDGQFDESKFKQLRG